MDNCKLRKILFEAEPFVNQGKTHIFLGSPFSDALDKTTVEAGNMFSPGMWSFGVFNMICDGEILYDYTNCTEKTWKFDEAAYPVIKSGYACENLFTLSSSLFQLGSYGVYGVDFCETDITAYKAGLSFIIAIGEEGPAGGEISKIKEIDGGIEVNSVKIIFETPPDTIIISENVKSAYAVFGIGGQQKNVKFKVLHAFTDRVFGNCARVNSFDTLDFNTAKDAAVKDWNTFRTKLICPDERIEKTYNNSLFHILSAMETGLPRISQWNYPVFWIRDCVIVLRALDYAGRSDLARISCDYLSDLIFCGGFGSESDNPGEGIWALAGHYHYTQDKNWLESVFSGICKRVDWIMKMLTAETPLFRASDARTVFGLNQPGVNIVCLENNDGTVHGRMDWHSPDFYINCWCYCGLYEAAALAEILGEVEKATAWKNSAVTLKEKITEKLLPALGNDRDSCISPYPCDIYGKDDKVFAEWFDNWYKSHRLTKDGNRNPEGLWTYFEAAQIHNAFLMGNTDGAWAALDGFLSDDRFGDLSVFIEGRFGGAENLPYSNAPQNKRGWLKDGALAGNMPHNWTSAETFNLIREMFVREDFENNRLLLANFVPKIWRKPGNEFGARNIPTMFGDISFIIKFGENGDYESEVKFAGKPADYKIML
jgi:hypothetical protein